MLNLLRRAINQKRRKKLEETVFCGRLVSATKCKELHNLDDNFEKCMKNSDTEGGTKGQIN